MAGTIRVVKSSGWTAMSNYHLRDKRLSLKGRGLLSTVLSLPDDWEYSIGGLAAICKESRDGIRTAINELESIGYVQRGDQERVDGKFTAGDYTIYEVPPAEQDAAHRVAVTGTVLPSRQQPHKEIIDNKILTTNPPKAPSGGERRKGQGRRAAGWMPERFEAFWSYYPRGEGKEKARQAWDKLKPDSQTIDQIARALQRQKQSPDWQRGIGIPYAATYLNQRRWEDEQRSAQVMQTQISAPGVDRW